MITTSQECRYPKGRPYQATTESIPYIVDTTEWTETPSSPLVGSVIDETSGTDVKTTVMPSGSPTVSGVEITLPLLTALTLGRQYRVEVTFSGPNSAVFACHLRVICNS